MDASFLDYVQVFLLAMIIVGALLYQAIRESSDPEMDTPMQVVGFFLLLAAWIAITALVIVVVVAIGWGGVWAWGWLTDWYAAQS